MTTQIEAEPEDFLDSMEPLREAVREEHGNEADGPRKEALSLVLSRLCAVSVYYYYYYYYYYCYYY